MRLRLLAETEAEAALAVARRAIRATENLAYSTAQVEAWLRGITGDRIRRCLGESWALGAFNDQGLMGFATLEGETGVLDLLFVDPRAWRRGVARSLVAGIEDQARSAGATMLRVDASVLLRPLLAGAGFAVEREYTKVSRGQEFANTWMAKPLSSPPGGC